MSGSAIDSVSAAIACHAFAFLDAQGLVGQVLREEPLDCDDLRVETALLSLETARWVERREGGWRLTPLGHEAWRVKGLIGLLFRGYGRLLPELRSDSPEELVDGGAVADASVPFGETTLDPLVRHHLLSEPRPSRIADLGCGSADRLVRLCEELGCLGLGLEVNVDAFEAASVRTQSNPQVEIVHADIARTKGVWEEVSHLISFFVLHDIYPAEQRLELLHACRKAFPKARRFLYADVMRPSAAQPEAMPGYDYIHSLLGIRTPTYEETHALFMDSPYRLVSEERIPGLPNSFLWSLELEPRDDFE